MESLSEKKLNKMPLRNDGVGSQMKYLFRWFIRYASPTCTCHADAAQYDEWGADRCEAARETILDRLQANADQSPVLKPVFGRTGAGWFVDLAIRRARRSRLIPPEETWWA